MNTIENNCCVGISKWHLSTPFEDGDNNAFFKIILFLYNIIIILLLLFYV